METAIFLALREIDPAVDPWRRRYDPSAAEGIPAHLTLLYPFARYEAIDAGALDSLAESFARFPPVDLKFSRARRFSRVLWLAPDDPEPVAAMIRTLIATYPEYPRYGGGKADIIPHLTIAHLSEHPSPESELDRIEAAFSAGIARSLPLATRCAKASLWAGDEQWRQVAEFELAG